MAGEAKIKVKVGSLELDYEGDPAFLSDGLEGLLEKMATLSGQAPITAAQNDLSASSNNALSTENIQYSTATIAAHLDAKTGPELTICAIAQLELMQGLSGVGRQKILDEMKTAKAYFNKSIGSNFSKTLVALTKKSRIHENGTDTYSLSAAEKKSLEAKIAEIG